jgi:hypothetical protein
VPSSQRLAEYTLAKLQITYFSPSDKTVHFNSAKKVHNAVFLLSPEKYVFLFVSLHSTYKLPITVFFLKLGFGMKNYLNVALNIFQVITKNQCC